jgi:hypothetical protein
MMTAYRSQTLILGLGLVVGAGVVSARPKPAPPGATLNAAGQKLEAQYAASLKALHAEVSQALPTVSAQKLSAFQKATEDTKKAEAEASAAQLLLGKVHGAKALVDHAKGKWIGGAEKGIATAQAALKKATTDAERDAAKKELANWEKNKQDGLAALKERQEAYDQAMKKEPDFRKAHEAAQAAFSKAQANERNAAKSILSDLDRVIASDTLDAKLAQCVVLTEAQPLGLAEFAQQGPEKAALVDKLLADAPLMRDMLAAGGAKFAKYGRAMEIYTEIQKASPKAKSGNLQRLALATSLEHAQPLALSRPQDQADGAASVDPVKRYQHYEKAFLDGELDPAFKNLSTWEYRMVVNCDAPDEILTWGREMLRTYRPDHIYNPDYGWRYVSSVRTEVPYGSQNVMNDRPSLQQYQNIIMNGGVCGRRAFFGRFILRSFGIPTWGVTQKAHAALSHWTPKGWVVNLGAGFPSSWWDKDEAPMSGNQFLLETQARAHTQDFPKVLRARWVSSILGEPAYNERKKITGGVWSNMAHYLAIMLGEKAVTLGPLGQELAEANEKEQKIESATVSAADQKASVNSDGSITIPAVAHSKPSGKSSAMKSFAGGMQLHCLGGFKAAYEVDAPQSGDYMLTARVATVQTGQKFAFTVGNSKQAIETDVPYTCGMWEETTPIKISLESGKNTILFELKEGSRGVTIKDLTLTPVK